jgi:hypothetical protein
MFPGVKDIGEPFLVTAKPLGAVAAAIPSVNLMVSVAPFASMDLELMPGGVVSSGSGQVKAAVQCQ